MQIRKNTKAFKTILEIISACQDRLDREKLIRLYITKAGHSIRDRISVEGIQAEAGLFFEMNFQAVLNNLKSPNHQLHQSDEIPGIYFFHGTSNKVWDQTPFEFDEVIIKEFASLPDLPFPRKKEKAEKFVFPTPNVKVASKPVKKEKAEIKKEPKTVETKQAAKKIEKGPKQPDFKLKHKILFTELERIVFRQARLDKEDVLNYYNKAAEYILPYLKDKPLVIHLQSSGAKEIEYGTLEALRHKDEEIPDWIQTSKVSKDRDEESLLLCNDKEHLLFYANLGCVQFNTGHARTKFLGLPDYLLIGIESPETALGKAVDVALAAKHILSGLQLPSFVKTDGPSGLHIYIPLDSKSQAEACMNVAEYLCKLIRIRVPDFVSLKGADSLSYGKVSLDYLINEPGSSVVTPYSLVAGESAIVATPLLWEEVNEGLRLEDFNHETIFKRFKQVGDPFENIFKKKVNADALLERMNHNYSFLFE